MKTELLRCYFCGKISTTQEEHDYHEQEHEGEQTYKCRKCEAKFLTKEDAREHLTKAHSSEEKSFHCTTCFKSFKNRYQLILHTRSHTGEKPFECPECNRCFSISSNLQKHMVSIKTLSSSSFTQVSHDLRTHIALKNLTPVKSVTNDSRLSVH